MMTRTEIVAKLKIIATESDGYARRHAETLIAVASHLTYAGLFEGLSDAEKYANEA